jgi:hypothetical protein
VPGAPFPCSKPFENESNLCIEQPYPVPIGTTAFAVWRIADFVSGCFDKGDGRGCIGPIYREQRVDIPNVHGPRTVRLIWTDHAGNTRDDSMVVQIGGIVRYITYPGHPWAGAWQPWGDPGGSDR